MAQTDAEPLPEAAEASDNSGTQTAALRSAIKNRNSHAELAAVDASPGGLTSLSGRPTMCLANIPRVLVDVRFNAWSECGVSAPAMRAHLIARTATQGFASRTAD